MDIELCRKEIYAVLDKYNCHLCCSIGYGEPGILVETVVMHVTDMPQKLVLYPRY